MSTLKLENIKHESSSTNNMVMNSDGSVTATGNVNVTGDLAVDTNTLKVDATNNHVGFGTATPQAPIDATLAAGGDWVARFQNTTSATPYGVQIYDAASAATGYPLLQVTNSAGSGTYFRVDSGTGRVTMPQQPGWHGTHADAYNNAFSAGSAFNMDASLERYNVGNHFNYSNDRFTCPVSGYYLVYGWDICLNSSSIYDAGNAIGCWKNTYSGANRLVSVYRQYSRGYQFTGTAYLAANDYVTFGNTEGAIGAGGYYGSLSYSGYGIRLIG